MNTDCFPPAPRRAAATVVVVILAVIAAAVTAAAAPARARGPVTRPPIVAGSRYLALGDSVTFGYQEPQVVPAPNYRNAASFANYPAMIGQQLRLRVTNASCPGETTASLINAKAPSNKCENGPKGAPIYRKLFPLHVRYRGSQLAFAVSYLRTHRNVRLVSLLIGANDLFLCQANSKDGCLSSSELNAVFSKVSRNIRVILSTLRNKAHYRGQLVLLKYYSLDYSSALVNGIINRLNSAIVTAGRPFRVLIGDAWSEFKAGSRIFGGSPCKAGLLTSLSTGRCGVHPSYSGQALLGRAVMRAARSTG